MIDLSVKNIKKVSNETGFIKDNVEKVMRLIDSLEMIFSEPWGKNLVLKGGTAINMFYRNEPRLSVDIDLDYIGKTREEMTLDKEKIKEYLEAMMYQKGYSLSNNSKSYFALNSFVFQYMNNAGNRDNIKIEINYLDRAHIMPINKYKIDVLGYRGDIGINVSNLYELYGSKFAALIGRCKPRDVYDVSTAIETGILENLPLLKKCIIFYNCVGGDANILDLNYDLLKINTKRDFNRMLKPLLAKFEKFNDQDAIKIIDNYLKKLLIFTDEEKAFIENFKNKVYQPNLLFDDSSIINRINWHPMAYWKCNKTSKKEIEEQNKLIKIDSLMSHRGKESLTRLSDIEIICIAEENTENNNDFLKLYNGYNLFDNQDDNEKALIKILLGKCHNDEDQVFRIFKSSGQFDNKKTDGEYKDIISKLSEHKDVKKEVVNNKKIKLNTEELYK